MATEREGLKRLARDVFGPDWEQPKSPIFVMPEEGDEWVEIGQAADWGFTFDETSEWNQMQIKRQAALYQMATQVHTSMTFHAQQVSNAFMKMLSGMLNWPPKPLLHNGRKPTARRRKR
jgi:hypothetical protein